MSFPLEPVSATRIDVLIDRIYRESEDFQWVRESLVNAMEANATSIFYGTEWQGVANKGVYRRLILDNGDGIPADKMQQFLTQIGGSGRAIGDIHENYGSGFKSSTLPWNHHGIVVISRSREDGTESMMRLKYDPIKPVYGSVREEVDGVPQSVYAPYDATATDGIDYNQILPADWESGFAIILFGMSATDDTILGSSLRSEASIRGISRYINTRMWELPIEVKVEEFHQSTKALWPKHINDKMGLRTARGAKHFVHRVRENGARLTSWGKVPIDNGLATITWYLRNEPLDKVNQYEANQAGYIACLYNNELYAMETHGAHFRACGIPPAIKGNIYLIIEPRVLDKKKKESGIYPNGTRTELLLGGVNTAGVSLPLLQWKHEFALNMPDEIQKKINEQRSGSNTINDDAWRERLKERFGHLWRIEKRVAASSGPHTVRPVQRGARATTPGTAPATTKPIGKPDTNYPERQLILGMDKGDQAATKRKVAADIPKYERVSYSSGNFEFPWVLAVWSPPTQRDPGKVLINVDHDVLQTHINYLCSKSFIRDVNDQAITDEVIRVYGELAVCHVAHSEYMRKLAPENVINEMRSPTALTMALLGMMASEALIRPSLGGKGMRIAS